MVVHGTMQTNLDSILRTGLNRMSRNHIHFAQGLFGEAKSGAMFSSECVSQSRLLNKPCMTNQDTAHLAIA
jgi:RNA:NAD 2'-phosphotransferase (TPT1/KptA family)